MQATFPRRLTQDDLDEIAVLTLRLAEGMLAMARAAPPSTVSAEIVRRRRSFIDDVRRAEKRVVEIKRAGAGRLAAAIERLKAKDQYGEYEETGVLARQVGSI